MKHSKTEKTNAARLLDNAGVDYELVPYPVDESDLSAVHVASVLGEDVRQVFKTLVLRGDKTGFFVCVIPAFGEVDLKKAARLSGNKKAEMLHVRDLLPVTGYMRGGCSPIGMKKAFPAFFDESCLDFPFIYVSAGCRGLQLKLNPVVLLAFVKAKTGKLLLEFRD